MESSMTWQPIETAPKDGTCVLVLFEVATVDVAHIAFYRSKQDWDDVGNVFASKGETETDYIGWWSYVRNSVTQERLDGWRTPKYWMPLPESPFPV